MNKQIKIAIAGAAIVALAMGLLVGLASKEKNEEDAALTQRTSAASASTGYVVSTGYTTYEGKSGKGSKGTTTNTVSYTIKDCELYYLQSSTYAGKSGKGSKGRRDLSSKGSKSYGGEGIDVYCATHHSHAMMSMSPLTIGEHSSGGGGGFIEYFEGGKSGKGSSKGSSTYAYGGGKSSKGNSGTYAYTTSHVDVIDVVHSGDTTTTHGDIDIEYVETSSGGKSSKGSTYAYTTTGGKSSKGGTYAYTATTNHYEIAGGPVDVDHSGGHWEGGTDHGGQIEEVVPVATNPNWN